MRPGLLVGLATFAIVLLGTAGPAWAGDPGGQYSTSSGTAGATVSGGTITVKAGAESWTPPAATNPDQTNVCTYVVPDRQDQHLMGIGGPIPGKWVVPICTGSGPTQPFWVTDAAQASGAPVGPAALAQEALSKLALQAPAVEMAPPSDQEQLVNVSTWLWIDPAAWRGLSATATAGPVTATATAAPAEVVWQMGDGQSVTCLGPGTSYDPSDPNATTDCSYTWTQSSAGQPGGVYQVTATVYYRAAWTATGAPGGGNLGLVAGPSAHVAVRVAESEAINNSPGS